MTADEVPTLRALGVMARTAFRADSRGSIVQIVLSLLNAASVAQVVGLGWLIDAAEQRDAARAFAGAALIAGLGCVSRAANNVGFRFLATLRDRTDLLLDQEIMALTASVPGIEHHERPDYANEIQLLRSQRGNLSAVLQALVGGLVLFFRSLITLALLVNLHPLLLLLPLFSIPSVLLSARGERLMQRSQERLAEPTRLLAHLFRLSTTAVAGKELRVFGLHDEIPRRYGEGWRTVERATRRVELQAALLSTVGWVVFAVGFVGAIAFVAVEAVNGRATTGDVVVAFTLAGQINGQVAGAVGTMTFLMRGLRVAARLVWLQEYARGAVAGATGTLAVPERLRDGIRFVDVTFRYPGTDVDVLQDASFHLPAGSTVAVVGENGAGKSTLVKLLCRLYEPTNGHVEVDGIPLRDVAVEEWRRRLSGGFQDFTRFELVARETVGVGDLSAIEDDAKVRNALTRAAAQAVVDDLPEGLATQLGRSFGTGSELSGGQWQKLALGRAMMRDGPLVLVLDEPTAALDAEAEHALFERFAGAAREAARASGAITLLVSHRFSTVRMADVILVIDGGRIAEAGSHEELMAGGGLYAELYELQARAYR